MAGYYGFTLDVHVYIRRILYAVDNLSKNQWIFTKFGMCIDILAIWFGIAIGQISSNFDRIICRWHAHIFVSRWQLE